MFTGIVTHRGIVRDARSIGGDLRLAVETPGDFMEGCAEGDSISVSGICLTALQPGMGGFESDVSSETIACTTVGQWRKGTSVNLERAVAACGRLDGHIVTGHVDGRAELVSRQSRDRGLEMMFAHEPELGKFIAVKGSVCLDGVSLTVNRVQENTFSIMVIPHTLEATSFGGLEPGAQVNLEVDLLARYVDRLFREKGNPGQ